MKNEQSKIIKYILLAIIIIILQNLIYFGIVKYGCNTNIDTDGHIRAINLFHNLENQKIDKIEIIKAVAGEKRYSYVVSEKNSIEKIINTLNMSYRVQYSYDRNKVYYGINIYVNNDIYIAFYISSLDNNFLTDYDNHQILIYDICKKVIYEPFDTPSWPMLAAVYANQAFFSIVKELTNSDNK